jgi:serine/threonine protein kinase
MAPESLKHVGYESKSDIWYDSKVISDVEVDVLFRSVGCLLYEMCTYQHAFDGKDLMNVVYKIVEGKTPDIPKMYSKELNDLLKK